MFVESNSLLSKVIKICSACITVEFNRSERTEWMFIEIVHAYLLDTSNFEAQSASQAQKANGCHDSKFPKKYR